MAVVAIVLRVSKVAYIETFFLAKKSDDCHSNVATVQGNVTSMWITMLRKGILRKLPGAYLS